MKTAITLLNTIFNSIVDFVEYSEETLLEITRITTCSTSSACNKPYCMKSQDTTCKLLLPKYNLLTNLDNEEVYFARLSDELLRFNRIKHFIFDPNTHINFGNIEYNLHDNEIILLASLLTSEYFKDIEIVDKNIYINTNTYDTAKPSISQYYDPIINAHSTTLCVPEVTSITGKWQDMFDTTCTEHIYKDIIACGYTMVIDILQYEGIVTTIQDIKAVLRTSYKDLFANHRHNLIYDKLSIQGKKDEMILIKGNMLEFEDFLLSDNYFLTILDLWLIATHYKIGIIGLSSTSFIENNKNILPLYNPSNNHYYFVKIGGSKHNKPIKYRVIYSNTKTPQFNRESILPKLRFILTDQLLTNISINDFIIQKKKIKIVKSHTTNTLKNPIIMTTLESNIYKPIKIIGTFTDV
jgi:hypothetical protein